MKISFLISMLTAIREKNGDDVEVLAEIQSPCTNDDLGYSYHYGPINGFRFSEGEISVTLLGEMNS